MGGGDKGGRRGGEVGGRGWMKQGLRICPDSLLCFWAVGHAHRPASQHAPFSQELIEALKVIKSGSTRTAYI